MLSGSALEAWSDDDIDSEWRRKEMKEVLPLFLAPRTRTLEEEESQRKMITRHRMDGLLT